MTFKELIERTEDIDLEKLRVFLGKQSNLIDSVSCFQDGLEWVEKHIDDRQNTFEIRGTEEVICEYIFVNIMMRKNSRLLSI